jgi:hypothetical protein
MAAVVSGGEALGVEQVLRCPICKTIRAGLQWMAIMTLELSPLNVKFGIEPHQLGP